MNEQVSDKPKGRWLWIVAVVAVIFVVLLWGFQTAIQMEEGAGDTPAAPAT